MNSMVYNFKFKRKGSLFSKTFKCVGHNYLQSQDKMIIYFFDGSITEIVEWSKCSVTLGMDWLLAQKENIKQNTGVNV